MATITVNIKTLQQKDYPIQIAADATIAQMKQIATDTLGLGTATTCVYKGAPLKDDNATLSSVGINDGEHVITVFKKAKPVVEAPAAAASAPAPVAAPAAAAPATTTAAPVPSAPVAAPAAAAAAPAAAPAVPVEWSCTACTYINTPARTICEMCGTPNPNRPMAAGH